MFAVGAHGGHRVLGADVMSEGEAHPLFGGHQRAVITGAKQPDGRQRHIVGDGGDGLEEMTVGELVRKKASTSASCAGKSPAPEPRASGGARERLSGRCRERVRSQIDPVRMQGFQDAEGLHYFQGRMIGEHDAARADADARGGARYMPNQDFRGRAGYAGHIVMLGQPEASVAKAVSQPRQVNGVPQGLGAGRTGETGERSRTEMGSAMGHSS